VQLKQDSLRILIFSLPGWSVIFKAIELALLRSKDPHWFGLYSTPKLLAISFGLILGVLWIKFATDRLLEFFKDKKLDLILVKLSPTTIFVCSAIIFRLFTLGLPVSVGEDLTPQILSSIQWNDGQTTAPNFVKNPSPADFSIDREEWIPRPPGASWMPLPGLLLGLSVGNSIQLALFTLALAGGIGWLRLAQIFGFYHWQTNLLALTLALPIGILSISFSTASVISSAVFPWLIIWARKVSLNWAEKPKSPKSLIWTVFFFFILGGIAWIKLSSILTVGAIVVIPFLFLIFTFKTKRAGQFGMMLGLGLLVFLIPYYLLSKTNEKFTGYSSDQLYSQQDYNAQYDLWGKHFSESTQGWMLLLSLTAGPGYALPVKPIIHGLRDLVSQFSFVRNFFLKSKTNLPIFCVGIASIGLSGLLFCGLFRICPCLSNFERSCYFAIFIIPFIGLGAVSKQHGFNYILYSTYTSELSAIFTLFSLRLLEVKKLKMLSGRLLVIICLAFPLYSFGKKIVHPHSFSRYNKKPSTTEKKRALGKSNLSEEIGMAKSNSISNKDICFFFCKGSSSDYRLRTSMRSLSLHFADNNLRNSPDIKSSKPLNIFCILDSKLCESQIFKKELFTKFPANTEWTKISNKVWKAALP
jgi:hypothetical protein